MSCLSKSAISASNIDFMPSFSSSSGSTAVSASVPSLLEGCAVLAVDPVSGGLRAGFRLAPPKCNNNNNGNKCFDKKRWKYKFPAFIGNHDRPSNRSTNRPTKQRQINRPTDHPTIQPRRPTDGHVGSKLRGAIGARQATFILDGQTKY